MVILRKTVVSVPDITTA